MYSMRGVFYLSIEHRWESVLECRLLGISLYHRLSCEVVSSVDLTNFENNRVVNEKNFSPSLQARDENRYYLITRQVYQVVSSLYNLIGHHFYG